MMELSDHQVEWLKGFSLTRDIDEVIAHCQEMFPSLVALQGKAHLRSYGERGVALAKEAGFTEKGSVCLFIEMMIILGVGFEHDPLHSWLTPDALDDSSSQLEKSMARYEALKNYLDTVYGEKGVFFEESLQRLRHITINTLPVNPDSYPENVHALLRCLYPQRYDFIGYNTINTWLAFADGQMKNYEVTRAKHQAYMALIMFLFGYQFDQGCFGHRLNFTALADSFSQRDNQIHDAVVSCYSCLKMGHW